MLVAVHEVETMLLSHMFPPSGGLLIWRLSHVKELANTMIQRNPFTIARAHIVQQEVVER